MVSLQGLNKADVLAALYNASRPQGLGFMHYEPVHMTRDEAEQLLQSQQYFDYLKGRVMKVKIHTDDLDERLYDRDNGAGAAQRAIDELRASSHVVTPAINKAHEAGKITAAFNAYQSMERPTKYSEGTMELTLADVQEELAPKVAEAIRAKQQ